MSDLTNKLSNRQHGMKFQKVYVVFTVKTNKLDLDEDIIFNEYNHVVNVTSHPKTEKLLVPIFFLYVKMITLYYTHIISSRVSLRAVLLYRVYDITRIMSSRAVL